MFSQLKKSMSAQVFKAKTGSGSGSSESSGGAHLIVFISSEKKTPFSPQLTEKMSRAKTMYGQFSKLIECVRANAQRNPLFRGERLVASAVNSHSERQQYAIAMQDASVACFDNVKPLGQYMGEMGNAMQAVAGYEDNMLRQIMLFVVKPLQEYVTVQYPKMMGDFAELERRRDRYDAARHKKADNLPIIQQQLMQQAGLMDSTLTEFAQYQMAGAKAVDTYMRAECAYMKEALAVVKTVNAPDNKKRWSV